MFETICATAQLVLIACLALVAVVYVIAMVTATYFMFKEYKAWTEFEDEEGVK